MRCAFIFALLFIATVAETIATTSGASECAQDYAAMLEQHELAVSRWRESQGACADDASAETQT